jgi:hypothetical protein
LGRHVAGLLDRDLDTVDEHALDETEPRDSETSSTTNDLARSKSICSFGSCVSGNIESRNDRRAKPGRPSCVAA